jgi:hypothetical protein
MNSLAKINSQYSIRFVHSTFTMHNISALNHATAQINAYFVQSLFSLHNTCAYLKRFAHRLWKFTSLKAEFEEQLRIGNKLNDRIIANLENMEINE